MKKILSRIFGNRNMNCIYIVSGLPRCGTSMMMQMLERGGMEVVTDNIRKADKDNPKGYYEFEKVKKIKEDTSWLDATCGKVFKMVSMLLYDLPKDRNYKVIFMKRDIDEMLASQKKMLNRLGREDEAAEQEGMKPFYEKHVKEIENWLKMQENIDVLYLNYNNILADPDGAARSLKSFIGIRFNVEEATRTVDKDLYRNKTSAGE